MKLGLAKNGLRSLSLFLAAPLLFACSMEQADGDPIDSLASEPEDQLATAQQALSARDSNLTFTADVSGDSWTDWITVTPANAFIVDPSESGAPTRQWLKHGGPPLERDQIAFVDFNGDKKTDVIVQGYDNKFWVSLSTGTTFSAPANWVTHGGTYRAGQAQYVDVNGDKKMDLVYQGLDNHFWVSVSTGTGFKPPANWVNHGGTFQNGHAKYGDFNGDGKDDLVLWGGGNAMWVSTSYGTGFTAPKAWVTAPSGTSYYYLTDYDHNGKDDIVFSSSSTGFRWVAISTGTGFNAPVRCGSC